MTQLTIVSTFVKDILWSEKDQMLSAQTGGPAYFFSNVFKTQNIVSYDLITGPEMEVDIKVIPGKGEFGKVKQLDISQLLPKVSSPNLLISTLYREWDLRGLNDYQGRVFLDVQGYVRNPNGGFGKKQQWREITSIQDKLFLVKGTELEVGYLPPDFVSAQKQLRCLVVTKGAEGSDVFYKGTRFFFRPSVQLNLPNTLGAGDTFLANLVKGLIVSEDLVAAAKQATQEATAFLKRKGPLGS